MATQVERVTQLLRTIIVSGEFEPNSRVPEVAIAERLGVSRTPVRLALSLLESEGLVIGTPNRGFRVRGFSVKDVMSAYEVRGWLEAFAARRAAEFGLSDKLSAELDACLSEGDRLLAEPDWDEDHVQRWSSMNDRFHRTIIEAADSAGLEAAFEAVARFPATDPRTFLLVPEARRQTLPTLRAAHAEHHVLAEAIKAGQASRAAYLIREHVYLASVNMGLGVERERARGVWR
jgi:GntR family transcriptional regulator of vanillate catabolism